MAKIIIEIPNEVIIERADIKKFVKEGFGNEESRMDMLSQFADVLACSALAKHVKVGEEEFNIDYNNISSIERVMFDSCFPSLAALTIGHEKKKETKEETE